MERAWSSACIGEGEKGLALVGTSEDLVWQWRCMGWAGLRSRGIDIGEPALHEEGLVGMRKLGA